MDGDTSSPTRSVAAARAIYRDLERTRDARIAEAEAARARGEGVEVQPLMRLRLAVGEDGKPTVDLSKADKDCPRCGGTGRKEDQRVPDPETGEVTLIPVICMCVHRGGGVAQDMLDRMLAAQQEPRR